MRFTFLIVHFALGLAFSQIIVSTCLADTYDNGQPADHNCRLWGSIAPDFPDSMLYKNLVSYPNSLKNLSVISNIDGWGIASYSNFGAIPRIDRGARRALDDPFFDLAVWSIDTIPASIVLAHIRRCTNGCCCRGCYTIPDPHPFWRYKNGQYWTFAHNGSISKAVLYELIGDEYLAQNPPNGSGLPACDPADTSLITDSELFFIYLLKTIEEYQWDTTIGLRQALLQLLYNSPGGALNFVISDASGLWAFRKGNTLFSYYDSLTECSAVASDIPPNEVTGWQPVAEYQLLHLQAGERPLVTDLRSFLPPIVACIPDTTIYFAPPREVCLTGFDFSDPDGNIVSVVVEPGWIADKLVCFHPIEGSNVLTLTVTDNYGNVAACSTEIIAFEAVPGTIAGTVIDSSSAPLAEVTVTIDELSITATTDSSGHFIMPYIVPGAYDIRFSLRQFFDTTAVDVPVVADDTTKLEITLRLGCDYLPGDINGDSHFDGLDVVYGVNYLKGGGQPPPDVCNCPYQGPIFAAADANGSCIFNGIDVTYCVNFLKSIGPRPVSCRDCPPQAR